ncbi:hypothetical protein BSL78_13204 [Apostichopus japonicus]|uniref:BPTI/Kunitz inhibitor domain-containing protein n=2 Tax=Stichopus japonicus TaxID=307972 RepID=A0A2G8KPJ7_STIJA|nr:hypothetical protein BSL78_13204 [Apostichopus japonicus]
MFLASVLLCYAGFSYARKESREIFGKCKERQKFKPCGDIMSLYESRSLYSFNPRKGKCEHVFEICSTARANVFRTMRKCNKFCGSTQKGCYVRGKWYKHKDWMTGEGCCMCLNGLMACATCEENDDFCENCPRHNRPIEETQLTICRYGEDCDEDDDCTCKSKEDYCEEQCEECEDGDSECPEQCDCEVNLWQQLVPNIY